MSGARISFPVWKKESHQFGHFSNFQQPHTISSDDRESNFLVKETRLSLSTSVDFSLSLARTRSCGHPPLCPAKGRIYLWTSVPRGISIFRKENQKKRCWSETQSPPHPSEQPCGGTGMNEQSSVGGEAKGQGWKVRNHHGSEKEGAGRGLVLPRGTQHPVSSCFLSAWSLRACREIAHLLNYLLEPRGCRLYISL